MLGFNVQVKLWPSGFFEWATRYVRKGAAVGVVRRQGGVEAFSSKSSPLGTDDGVFAEQPVGQSVALALHGHHSAFAQLVAAKLRKQLTALRAAVDFQCWKYFKIWIRKIAEKSEILTKTSGFHSTSRVDRVSKQAVPGHLVANDSSTNGTYEYFLS